MAGINPWPARAAMASTVALTWDKAKKINKEYRQIKPLIENTKGLINYARGGFKNLPTPYSPYQRRPYTRTRTPTYYSHRRPTYQRARAYSNGNRGYKYKRTRRTPYKRYTPKYKSRSTYKAPMKRTTTRTVKQRLTSDKYSEVNRLLGPPPGTQLHIKKRYDANGDYLNKQLNTLYGRALIKISFHNNDQKMRNRSQGAVDMLGIDLRRTWHIKSTSYPSPIVIRWALLVNKDTQTGTTSSTDVTTTDFFKHFASATVVDGAHDFSTNQNAQQYEARVINPRKWLVLREGRKVLAKNKSLPGTDTTDGGNKQQDTFASIHEYIPLNTQMRWATNTAGDEYPVDNNIWFV